MSHKCCQSKGHDQCCQSGDQSCCHAHGGHDQCHEHHHHHNEHENFAQQLLDMADDAWMEVLHEKIKDQIRATSGKHLDKLAKLVSESNKGRWENKMVMHHSCKEFREKICEFFSQK